MDFTKFVSLLEKAALLFSAAINLGDPLEGSLTSQNVAARWEQLSGLPPDKAAEANEYLSRTVRDQTKFVFVNCWHVNSVESAAMWAQYGAMDRGIAIKTSFDRLTTSLHAISINEREMQIHAGLVQYVNYETAAIPEGNLFFPYIHKRTSFEHEHELRLLFFTWPIVGEPGNQQLDLSLASPPGIYIPVDLAQLIRAVHMAPGTRTWVRELVRSVLEKFDIDRPVIESSLSAATPLY
jgi:hypothetical protein